jgi:hypothetical protein
MGCDSYERIIRNSRPCSRPGSLLANERQGILFVALVLVAALIYRFLVTRLLLPGKSQD